MAEYTPNYNLSKPENTDTQSSFISDYCDNMDKIDANLGGGHTIYDPNGTAMARESGLQFTGGVTVTDDNVNGVTVVNVTGGGGGSVNDVLVNGVSVVDGNGDAQIVSYKEVTQAEYDALPNTKLSDGIMYAITDATPNPYPFFKVVNGELNLIFDDGN